MLDSDDAQSYRALLERDAVSRGSVWQHYRTGGQYRILSCAVTEDNLGEVRVVYQGVEGGDVWSRPISDWLASVGDPGEYKPRFKLVQLPSGFSKLVLRFWSYLTS